MMTDLDKGKATLLLRMRKHWLAIGASILLGLIFFTFGLGKIYPSEFLVSTLLFPPLLAYQVARWLPWVARWLPWIEMVLGSLLIIGIATKLMASFSVVLIVAFIANNSWLIYHGLGYKPCGCSGHLSTMSVINSLYLDIGMLVLVFIILSCYPGNFLSIRPYFLEKEYKMKPRILVKLVKWGRTFGKWIVKCLEYSAWYPPRRER